MTLRDDHDSPDVHVPIAVVGVSALFPGSLDEGGFWRDILAGRDLVSDVPASHWLIEDYYDPDPKAPDKTYAKRGAFLSEVPFDPMAFGIPPSIAPATDTSQLLGLIVAQRVLEDAAGGDFSEMDREKVSVILGVTSGQELLASMVSRLQRPVWQKSLREAGIPESKVESICQRIADHYVPWQESSFPGLLGNVVAGRDGRPVDRPPGALADQPRRSEVGYAEVDGWRRGFRRRRIVQLLRFIRGPCGRPAPIVLTRRTRPPMCTGWPPP